MLSEIPVVQSHVQEGREAARFDQSTEDAFATAQEVSVREGLAVGISSGANIWAALQLAKRPEFAGKRIVTIACSPSERYLSTALAEKVRAEVTALTAS